MRGIRQQNREGDRGYSYLSYPSSECEGHEDIGQSASHANGCGTDSRHSHLVVAARSAVSLEPAIGEPGLRFQKLLAGRGGALAARTASSFLGICGL